MEVFAPMVGRVVSVDVKVGDKVCKNDTVATIEAMKMLVKVFSPIDGEIMEIKVTVGSVVESNTVIVVLR